MNIIDNIKMAIDSIKSNKLRSFLTMIGIIIGINSVICIISLGRGGKEVIMGEFEKIGSSTVKLRVDFERASLKDYFKIEDIDHLKNKSQNIKYATAISMKAGHCENSDIKKEAYIIGATPDYKYIENTIMLYGRYFNENDLDNNKMICVIDEITAERLFGYSDVIGEKIFISSEINSKKLEVIGVSKAPMYMAAAPKEYMKAMITIPLTSYQYLYGKTKIDSVYIVSNEKETLETATQEAIKIITARHNNRDKEVYISEQMVKQIEQVNKVINIFSSFISAVAAISLVVGGIGVMNIMLVSVTERTREIGLRKAIGATTRSILFQFLSEAIIISFIGGVIGLLSGLIFAFLIGQTMSIKPVINIIDILLVLLFSSSVGVFFGIYPARKAAKLNPIDALRYE